MTPVTFTDVIGGRAKGLKEHVLLKHFSSMGVGRELMNVM
jgi:hypothetical protein